MKRRQIATGAVALTTAIALAGAGATMAHAAGNTNDNIRLANSGRGSLLNSNTQLRTLGDAPSATNVSMSIAVPLRNQALLNSMLAKGTVISPAEYTRLFGASQSSLKKVADWAKSQGLQVTSTNATSGTVSAQAPVRTVNKAFSLKMQRVSLGAHTGMAPSAAPLLPRSLGVVNVAGLNTVSTRKTGPIRSLGSARPMSTSKISSQRSTGRVSSPFSKSRSMGTKVTAAAAVSNNCATTWGSDLAVSASKFKSTSNMLCGYSPQQAVTMYNAGSAKNAKSNIGLLLWCDDKNAVSYADTISTYFKYTTLGSKYHDMSQKEGSSCANADYGEQNMDIQTSHYMSPQANIYYYGASDSTDSALLKMFQKAVTDHKVSTISMSWGGDEQPGSSFQQQFDRTAAQASLTGISLFASSGDMGDGSIQENDTAPSRAKHPSYPATSPYFTAVGGTAAAASNASASKRAFTTGWSNTLWEQPKANTTAGITKYPFFGNSVGAGGGISGGYAQPAWQKGVVTGSSTKRTIPDVSAIADPATGLALTFDGENISTSGGTSQSSPLVASLVASSKALTGRKVGNAAPYFYKLKGTTNITDVKATPAGQYGMVFGQLQTGQYVLEGINQPADSLRVATGWDNVTGLGEPSGSFLTAFGK